MDLTHAPEDYKKIFSELIRKQIVILGPNITLARVKSVPGLEVNENGDVLSIQGDPQIILQNLINQFVELSGLIVKKTMESILSNYTGLSGLQTSMQQVINPIPPVATVPQVQTPVSQPSATSVTQPSQTVSNNSVPSGVPQAQAPQQPLQSQNNHNSIEDLNKMIQGVNQNI